MQSLYQLQHGKLAASTAALNRGMLYGDGFFESMRWHNGKILLKQLHNERIRKSAELLQLNLGDFTGFEALESQLQAIHKELHLRIRVLVLRGGAGLYLPADNHATIYIQVQELETYYTLNENGLKCFSYKDQVKAAGKYSCIKSTSALHYVMASLAVKEKNAEEAIIYNAAGRICEGTSTNVFLCSGKKILTPSLAEGCVEGVFRSYLILVAKSNGYTILETEVTEKDLLEAEELWFTSGIRGLLWAASCEEKKFVNTEAQQLHSLLLKEVL
jgi:branched-chain amino acid aminotransferase